MNTKKKQHSVLKNNEDLSDSYDYLTNAASSQDCTGLIASAPESCEELEAYEELYHFLPPNGRTEDIHPETKK